jgi:hypothetical protein
MRPDTRPTTNNGTDNLETKSRLTKRRLFHFRFLARLRQKEKPEADQTGFKKSGVEPAVHVIALFPSGNWFQNKRGALHDLVTASIK